MPVKFWVPLSSLLSSLCSEGIYDSHLSIFFNKSCPYFSYIETDWKHLFHSYYAVFILEDY